MSTFPINLDPFGHKNAKVMAKKQIRMHGVIGISTGVSCIQPIII